MKAVHIAMSCTAHLSTPTKSVKKYNVAACSEQACAYQVYLPGNVSFLLSSIGLHDVKRFTYLRGLLQVIISALQAPRLGLLVIF